MPHIPKQRRKFSHIVQTGELFHRTNSRLGKVFAHASELVALQVLIRSHFPGEVYVASIKDGSLHLITPSASLATRLKYRQKAIIATIKQSTSYLKNPWRLDAVKISVRPRLQQPKRGRKPFKPLSMDAAEHILDAAKHVDNEELREVLLRLSKR